MNKVWAVIVKHSCLRHAEVEVFSNEEAAKECYEHYKYFCTYKGKPIEYVNLKRLPVFQEYPSYASIINKEKEEY